MEANGFAAVQSRTPGIVVASTILVNRGVLAMKVGIYAP